MPERLEARRLLAADPIHVGLVYIETDYLESDQDVGSDSRGDRFILSFTGGAPETELSEVRIRTDKDSDGLSVGDPIFDTEPGGRGKAGAHGFELISVDTGDGRTVNAVAEVQDGSQELVLKLSNFRAGDKLEFTLDVDEVLRNSQDLAVFNDRLDVITSGQEFQDSLLEATFHAPHYEASHADAIFLNDYGTPSDSHGLDLPPDEGSGPSSRPNRSAAALGVAVQVPKPVEIEGRVWVDNDLDARREPGEQLVPGVSIALWKLNPQNQTYVDTGLRSVTDADGRYRFAKSLGILPGTYRLVQSQPDGLLSVAAVPGQVAGQSSGTESSPNVLSEITIPLGDTSAVNYDFGEAQRSSVSGFVYRDNNDNGRRDGGETGLAGVRVQLVPVSTLAAQSPITVTTAADGSYRFTDLPPGQYQIIELDQPADYLDGRDQAGRIDGRQVGQAENPGDQINGVVLAGNDHGVDYNFGELPLSSLSGFVFLAAPGHDCDGGHDVSGSEPIAGARLELQDALGNVIQHRTSGHDGSYRFDDLPPGNYQIVQFTPDGLIDGYSHVGTVANVAIGTSVGGGLIRDITLDSGRDGVAYNFCEAAPASISGFVYHDRSDDGTRDAGETGIANAQISVTDGSGSVVATTRTDASGWYEVTGLPPGQYSVRQQQPAGYFDGTDTPGTVRGQQLGRLGPDGDSIIAIDLKQGDDAVEFNFGELQAASLSGRVHVDADGDCEYDSGEVTPEGVVIRLIDSAGTEVARTTTDASGRYTFGGIAPGRYSVIEEQPSGLFEGAAKPGSAGGTATSPNRIGGVSLASGEVAVDYDFCERPPAEINGSVYADADGDCVLDPGESGIASVRVELYDSAGQLVASTQTNEQGAYRFSNLPAGEYSLREIQPAGWLQGGQVPGSEGGDGSVTDRISGIPVGWGERLTNYNFCEHAPATISGSVFVDSDGDCLHDANELGISDVSVVLRDESGTVVATTTTNGQGRYHFGGLRHGNYHVIETQPEGFYDGDESPGTGDGTVVGNDHLGVSLGIGQSVVDYNFCELQPASLRGRVWQESISNVRFDAGDIPVPGVLIELIDESGGVVATSRTDAGGNYHFQSIRPGVYSVRESQPAHLFQGGQAVGTAGGEVGGEDLLVGIHLGSGADARDYDFAETPPASISGFVFQDGRPIALAENPDPAGLREYRDGLLTADDTRLAGVTIELRDLDGRPIDSSRALPGHYAGGTIRTVTDESGYYEFTGLRPGTYHVYEVQPDDYVDGLDTPGTTGGVAVNAADEPDDATRITIRSLQQDSDTDPGSDAILNVSLSAGQTSESNNFSEIVIVDPPPPAIADADQEEPADPQVLAPPPTAFDSFVRIATFAEPPRHQGAPSIADDEWAVAWHLSVINGGFPPGTDAADGLFRAVSAKRPAKTFQEGSHDRGRWTIERPGQESLEGEVKMTLGDREAIALTGDFDGDGSDETAIFVAGQWFVDLNGNGRWDAGDLWVQLGTSLDRPVVGDWDGDGKDDIGIFGRRWQHDTQRIIRDPGLPDPENTRRRHVDSRRPAIRSDHHWDDKKRVLRRGNDGTFRADVVDHVFQYGEQVDTPLAGDWNGDGIDQIAIFRGGQWMLDTDGDGRWTDMDKLVAFGKPGDEPIVGDFNGDGIDEVGVVRGDQWIIDTDGDRKITSNDLHLQVPREGADSQPVVGDFDGDGKDEPGYYDEAA